MLGIGSFEHLDDGRFSGTVHFGDIVVGRFLLDGELVQVIGRAIDDRTGTARRFHGDS